jgi:glycosyltransferase involved in cell wall biosynthesis
VTAGERAASRPRISAVVIAWNEEARLRECLLSVAWVDEIIVVDAESTDKTAAIAREFTDHVLVRPWPGFAAQKNFGIAQASGAWILSVDADETVSAELREEILAVVAAADAADGYRVPRRNIFWGHWVRHGRLYPDWQLRLFRRGRGAFVERRVHESAAVQGPVASLSAPLVHRSYRDVADFLERANRYSSLAADEWVAGGGRVRARDLVLGPLGRFLSMYVVHAGFLDGWRGFLLAVLYAYYVFVRWTKIWEKVKA